MRTKSHIRNYRDIDKRYDEFRAARAGISKYNHAHAKIIENLAHEGSPWSMIYIADAQRIGYIYEKDLSKAEGWYRLAAQNGLVHGLHGLALVQIERGEFKEALAPINKCLEEEFPPAIELLGEMFDKGQGVEASESHSLELWAKSMRLGNFWAKRSLARKFLSGEFGFGNKIYGIYLMGTATIDAIIIPMVDQFSDRLR